VIGLITGFLNVIPFAGVLIGLLLAAVVALANFEGLVPLIGVMGIFAVVQGLEGFVITPKVVGDRVGLNALETMVALIVGGNLAGFTGMLIAIPAAGILKYLLGECRDRYWRSGYYLRATDEGLEGPP
jgi:predicted PurR-regulated permease PerM